MLHLRARESFVAVLIEFPISEALDGYRHFRAVDLTIRFVSKRSKKRCQTGRSRPAALFVAGWSSIRILGFMPARDGNLEECHGHLLPGLVAPCDVFRGIGIHRVRLPSYRTSR